MTVLGDTANRRFLLEWLSKEDESSLGECDCPELRKMADEGLVIVRPTPGKPQAYSRVSLTEAGWKEVRNEP